MYRQILIPLLMIVLTAVVERRLSVDNSRTNLTVSGTSTLHDWEIKANECSGKAIALFEENKLVGIKKLDFKVKATSLKSGISSVMDNKTYSALKADDYPFITYQFIEMNPKEKAADDGIYHTKGVLTIAGVTRPVEMKVRIKELNEGLLIKGEVNLKMTDFNIDPPTAVFGSIKTGDEVTVKYETLYSFNH